MGDPATTPRAEAIEQFAEALRELRVSAGSPSFRTMSGRSHAISHTTLHDAVLGHRLPSWPTTAEFVKACGGDPADFRERWNRSQRAVQSAASSEVTDAVPPAPAHRRRRIALIAALAGALVVAVSVTGFAMSRSDGRRPLPSSAATGHALTAADCPVRQTNPSPATPAHPGDASAFITDLTLPDCTHVARGSTVVKVWRFKNVGTVPWRGYALHRIDMPEQLDQCQTIVDVPIDDTQPGEVVDIRVTVTAPNHPGFCFVRFKMQDASGELAFPGSRPVNFQIIVS